MSETCYNDYNGHQDDAGGGDAPEPCYGSDILPQGRILLVHCGGFDGSNAGVEACVKHPDYVVSKHDVDIRTRDNDAGGRQNCQRHFTSNDCSNFEGRTKA